MLDWVLLYLGFGLVGTGLVSVFWPIRLIGIRTRGLAWVVVAGGLFVLALAAKMVDSYFVYFGFALVCLGFASLLRPLRFLFIRSRREAIFALCLAGMIMAAAFLLPPGDKESSTATRLNDWMPKWQLGERHTIHVAASPDKVFAAIHEVRADEIFLFRTLIAIRRCGQDGPESILNPSDQLSLLDVATRTSFLLLAEEPGREIVLGTVVAAPRGEFGTDPLTAELFKTKAPPGVALATMNFLISPDNEGGSALSTETRIWAGAADTLRRFAVYWRVIHPGSDLIRRGWLRAIKARAEGKT